MNSVSVRPLLRDLFRLLVKLRSVTTVMVSTTFTYCILFYLLFVSLIVHTLTNCY